VGTALLSSRDGGDQAGAAVVLAADVRLAEAPLRNKSIKKGVLNYESTNENESTHSYNGEPSWRGGRHYLRKSL
jgi:hypothetical protein